MFQPFNFSAAKLLLLRWERANKVAQVAEDTFNQLMPPGGADTVRKWLAEETECYSTPRSRSSKCTGILVPNK